MLDALRNISEDEGSWRRSWNFQDFFPDPVTQEGVCERVSSVCFFQQSTIQQPLHGSGDVDFAGVHDGVQGEISFGQFQNHLLFLMFGTDFVPDLFAIVHLCVQREGEQILKGTVRFAKLLTVKQGLLSQQLGVIRMPVREAGDLSCKRFGLLKAFLLKHGGEVFLKHSRINGFDPEDSCEPVEWGRRRDKGVGHHRFIASRKQAYG